ncbi:TonB-dependent siderophore receptor [Synoicihabitans lomoniglobus]|uniref:TonB-dependent receptor plug domain-containing protein n=1 Tax=Synoicihabitans lomoniglobus TaxID=2909285 RepID=A0AAF0CSI0_9BACT|nr:TonB-dependent receptor plug domain-containing protein [Opitutaceae bacterium LMO-M01]WED67226.1 TonB-dependent receptor plug domain-containing protein [Opitutaceae bacterium LMO-M01]
MFPLFPRFGRAYAALSVGLISSVTLLAQVAVETNAESAEEDVVLLSVFNVDASQDKGYRAANTISGTSLNTAIQDLPMPLEVITSEFVDDLGATDFEEALKYTSGVFTDQYNESSGANSAGANGSYSAERSPSSNGGLGNRFSNAINIRSYNVQFQNRMGFRVGGTVSEYGVTLGGILDSLNYERIEVVRGPSSLLYGIGVLSGIANVVGKRPLPEHRFAATTSFGSFGFQRHTIEDTGPITDKLRYRFGYAHEERDDWTDFRTKQLDFFVGQLEFQPNSIIDLLIEYQRGHTHFGGTGTQYLYDDLNARSFGGALRNEFNEQINWARDFGGMGPEYRYTGPDTYEEREEWNLLANLDITPMDGLAINLGGYWGAQTSEDFDLNIATINNQESSLFVKRRIRIPTNPPTYRTVIQYVPDEYITVFENPPSPIYNDTTDFKTARYYWKNTPTAGEFAQYRARVNYEFETPFIGGPAQHNLLVGRHDIKDTIDYAQGTELFARLFVPNNLTNPALSEATDDPLVFRDIYDTEPITYNGELLAQPGREYQQTDLWYSGHYGVYQGRFWDDRIMVIGGLRHDRYQGLEKEYERNDGIRGVIDNPDNVTDGFKRIEYNFDEPIEVTTGTFAARYDIRDGLAVYALAAEGVSPNTGALDGNEDFIEAERSLSKEVGVKWELAQGRLSGTFSVYEIERKNAIWNFAAAPAPSQWVGGTNRNGNGGQVLSDFDPSEILSGQTVLNYGVDSSYFNPEDIAQDPVTRQYPDGILTVESLFNDTPNPQNVVFLDYNKLDAAGFRDEIERAFADVTHSRSTNNGDFDPIRYARITGTYAGQSASGNAGANVTFGDKAKGFDFQVIYSPIENWQMILNFAHTARSVSSPFDLVPAIDQVSGTEFGTEYDIWVRTLGRAAFGLEEVDNNGDGIPDVILRDGQPVSSSNIVPADSATGGLQGTSLFFGAKDEASFWSKYTIVNGPLRNLSLLFGAKYIGPQATAVQVGGSNLAANLYPTPPIEKRIEFDTGLVYTTKWGDTSWRFALNVYNLLDDQKDYSEVEYTNVNTGGIERRRSVLYHAPRSVRFSARMSF